MATKTDKQTIEDALRNGDPIPSGFFLDFSKDPFFWKPTPTERTKFFEDAGIDVKAPVESPVVVSDGS